LEYWTWQIINDWVLEVSSRGGIQNHRLKEISNNDEEIR
jgi:hypothetical protein